MQAADFFLVFTEPLNQAGIPHMVAGSVASIVYGEPRLTNDVDMVVVLNDSQIQALATLYPAGRFYCPPPDILAIESRRARRGHFNVIHHDTGLKADLYLAGDDPLIAWGLAHRQRVEIGNGQAIWIAPIEYVILKKLEYFREGRSEKHLLDIRGMLAVSGTEIDVSFLESQIAELRLTPEWELARQDPER